MKRWLLCDLHIHSTFSDGSVPLEEIVRMYGERAFDVIAITDHVFDTQSPKSLDLHKEGKSIQDLNAYFHLLENLAEWAKRQFDLLVLPGLEICNLVEDYHILGIDLKEAVDPNQSAMEVIRAIHRQGGLAIASHPSLKLSYFLQRDNESIQRHPLHLWKRRAFYGDKLDAWEIGNREDLFNGVSLEGWPFVANSDFHERDHLFSWKSLLFCEKEKEAIKKAIKERKVALYYFHENRGDRKSLSGQEFMVSDPPPPSPPSTGPAGGILIVDDEADLVHLISYHLRQRGYDVSVAYNGEEAWQKIQSKEPEMMILDLMMPFLDGWDLCRMVRQSPYDPIRSMGILILSARALQEDRVYGFEIGADDYLTKPFPLNELIHRVDRMMNKKKSLAKLKAEVNNLRSEMETKDFKIREVIHDLKSPLIAMGFSAKRMLRKSPDEETYGAFKKIYDSIFQLNQWIEDTFSSFGLSASEIKGELTRIEVEDILKKVVDLLQSVALEKNIGVELKASGRIPTIVGHEALMTRALLNLYSNALKFTPVGGTVVVGVTAHWSDHGTGVLEISFQDNGIGISSFDLERIFEPYYRGQNATLEEGKGLGLPFVKKVVELHGGRIRVQSELNQGSLFQILLPIEEGTSLV